MTKTNTMIAPKSAAIRKLAATGEVSTAAKPRARTFDEAVAVYREKAKGRKVEAIRADLNAASAHAQKLVAGVAGVDEASPVGAQVFADARRKYGKIAAEYAALKAELVAAEMRDSL